MRIKNVMSTSKNRPIEVAHDSVTCSTLSFHASIAYQYETLTYPGKEKSQWTQLLDNDISHVTFDASGFFAQQQEQVVTSIEVNFVFTIPNFPLLLETFCLDKNTQSYMVSIQGIIQMATGYSYILTYHFDPEYTANPFTSNVKTSDATTVYIDSPVFEQKVPVIVFWGNDPKNNPDFVQFVAKIYYDDPPYFPNIPASAVLPKPNFSDPAVISVEGSATAHSQNNLFLFANNNLSPLILIAEGTEPDGSQISWGPFYFNPADTPQLSFSKNYQFVYVTIDPSNVDWEINADNPSLIKIDILITAAYYISNGAQCTMPLGTTTLSTTWDRYKQKAAKIFYQIANLPVGYSEITFDWSAMYIYKTGVNYASGEQQKGLAVTLPKCANEMDL